MVVVRYRPAHHAAPVLARERGIAASVRTSVWRLPACVLCLGGVAIGFFGPVFLATYIEEIEPPLAAESFADTVSVIDPSSEACDTLFDAAAQICNTRTFPPSHP